MVESDLACLDRLLSHDFVLVHASGRVDTKESFLGSMRSGRMKYLSLDVGEVSFRSLGDTAAVLGGISSVTGMVDGVRVERTNRFSIVWHRNGTDWQAVHWQSTAIPATSRS